MGCLGDDRQPGGNAQTHQVVPHVVGGRARVVKLSLDEEQWRVVPIEMIPG